MKLPDHEIIALVQSGRLGIEPFDERQVQMASYDVRLANQWRTVEGTFFEADSLALAPGGAILGTTVEHVRLPDDVVGELAGKSSIGRLFIAVHVTAGYVDPTFEGRLTLEIVNLSPVERRLQAGQLIGQVSFTQLTSPCQRRYRDQGHYFGQVEPTPSYMENEVPEHGVLAAQTSPDGRAGVHTAAD